MKRSLRYGFPQYEPDELNEQPSQYDETCVIVCRVREHPFTRSKQLSVDEFTSHYIQMRSIVSSLPSKFKQRVEIQHDTLFVCWNKITMWTVHIIPKRKEETCSVISLVSKHIKYMERLSLVKQERLSITKCLLGVLYRDIISDSYMANTSQLSSWGSRFRIIYHHFFTSTRSFVRYRITAYHSEI